MEVFELILFSIVSSVLAAVLPSIVPVLARLCLLCQEVHGSAQVKYLDDLLLRKGFVSSVATHSCVDTPADGWHLVRHGFGFIVAIRRTARDTSSRGDDRVSYTIYTMTKKMLRAAVKKKDPNKIHVIQYEALMPWRPLTTNAFLAPPGAGGNPKQIEAVDLICERFAQVGRCSAILSGKPGGGKSATGMFVAQRLREKGLCSVVFRGFDLTVKGNSLLRFLPAEISATEPYILILDEIDGAFKLASTPPSEDKTEVSCLARNKGSLCTELDRLASVPNLIVIGTTNLTLEQLQTEYAAFVRDGRFDVRIGEF